MIVILHILTQYVSLGRLDIIFMVVVVFGSGEGYYLHCHGSSW